MYNEARRTNEKIDVVPDKKRRFYRVIKKIFLCVTTGFEDLTVKLSNADTLRYSSGWHIGGIYICHNKLQYSLITLFNKKNNLKRI